MYSTVMSGGVFGVSGYPVSVEADISPGLPCFDLVGHLSGEVKEARERVRVALKNSGIYLPPQRVTVNLSPANRKKEGTGYDLAIAIGILVAMGVLEQKNTEDIMFLGELGLNGELRPVKGVLPILLDAGERGIKACIVPMDNRKEAAVVRHVRVYPMPSLVEVRDFLSGCRKETVPYSMTWEEIKKCKKEKALDFEDVIGQEGVKRALQIAAAGFHHILLIGPPGSGKTMLAARVPGILPELTYEESLEVTSIYSVAGLLSKELPLMTKRPFLSPHHTSTLHGLIGGGVNMRPGAVSLSHRGVLFLDELPEFKGNVLDGLRQPLEDHFVQLSKNTGSMKLPADFLLVAAMNPCKCGFYPNLNKCHCTPAEVNRYLGRISGPIMDRMDLVMETLAISPDFFGQEKKGRSSSDIRNDIKRAVKIQQKRFKGTGLRWNSEMSAQEIKKYCVLEEEEKEFMRLAVPAMNLSARGYHHVLKVARTIADMEESANISKKHLSEAVCYRSAERKFRRIETGNGE